MQLEANCFMEQEEYKEFTINDLDKSLKRKELLQEELDTNVQEQVIVNKRIQLLKEFMKNIPITDPQYSILNTQLEMDRIDLDELKNQQDSIKSIIIKLNFQ